MAQFLISVIVSTILLIPRCSAYSEAGAVYAPPELRMGGSNASSVTAIGMRGRRICRKKNRGGSVGRYIGSHYIAPMHSVSSPLFCRPMYHGALADLWHTLVRIKPRHDRTDAFISSFYRHTQPSVYEVGSADATDHQYVDGAVLSGTQRFRTNEGIDSTVSRDRIPGAQPGKHTNVYSKRHHSGHNMRHRGHGSH